MHRFRFFSLLLTSAWLQTSGMAHAFPSFANTHGNDSFHSHDLVAHDLVAHNLVAHNLVAHNLVAHNLVAHNLVAHNLGGDRASTASSSSNPTLQEQRLQELYIQGVNDAAVPAPGENVHTLTPITPDNPHLIWNDDYSKVLVVTWKNQQTYDAFIKPNTHSSPSEAHVIWVTVAPEVQEFCQRYLADNPSATPDELDLRLKQHLGLHYDWNYDVFVELWVSPDDLFRPCVDPEITDGQCAWSLSGFSASDAEDVSSPTVPNIADYQTFYTNLYVQSFRGIPGVPWTGLGYTYDWGNPVTEVGSSEFIMAPNTAYQIHQVQPTSTYCSAEG